VNPKEPNRLSTPADLSSISDPGAPRTIVVSGVASGAGKTSLAVAVIAHLQNRGSTAGVKITVTHGDRGCPHGGKSCNVCSSLGGDFQVISRRDVIEQPGTDTARFVEAGASPVIWGITRDTTIVEMWMQIFSNLSSVRYVVVESNTLALALKPTLNLMIVDPTVSRRLWKPSARTLIAAADLVVFNERGNPTQRESTLSEVRGIGTRNDVLVVTHPLEATKASQVISVLDAIS
jgi:molybdopterin-guanine dinucleotide biosynthesis protein